MYSDERQVANLLNTEIHKMTIREAVEEDLLSPFSAIIAETNVDLTNVSIKSNGDYNEDELEQAINITTRNQAAIDLYQRLFPGQTAVAYCNSVKHAQDLAKLFTESGVTAGFISGYMDKKEQDAVLKKFHEGEIKVLCNADILIEGFDEPRASICLNLRPTKSLVNAQQRGGRVLRIDPHNPNKHAYIVDFLDKTEDPRKQSITFAEVAEAAFITTKKGRDRIPEGTSVAGPRTNDPGGLYIDEDVIEISGLKVTVNSQEIMRMIKEMQDKRYLNLQEGDLPITEKGLPQYFIGTWKTLIPIAESVIEEIRKNNPELIVYRKQRGTIIVVCTDPEKFIFLMKVKGAFLRKDNIIEESGFMVSSNNLQENFVGSTMHSLRVAQKVVEELRREEPELISEIYRGVRRVPYVKNKQRFIELMKAKGLLYRADQEVQNSEFIVSGPHLETTFIGSGETLNPIAQEVLEEIKVNYPDLVRKVMNVNQWVNVVTDRERFIEAMKKRGILLRSAKSRLGENEFPISQNSVRIFQGHHTRIKIIADEIAEKLKQEDPELVTIKYSGSRRVIVVTNRERFIREMLNRGCQLK